MHKHFVITGIDANPTISNVDASDDVTLTCSTRSPLVVPFSYSWHRVNGNIPSHASGQNTNRLTISKVTPGDEGEYYCMATWFGNCATSDNVMVTVKSKE